MQTKGQFSAGKIYQAIKAWASKQFLVFNSEAAKDYFRFVLISEISEHDVGLEMLDNVYNGWTIRNSYSSLEICPVINNEEQYPIITISRAKTTFTTVIEGINGTSNNSLTTKSYVDSKSINFPGNPQYANKNYLDADKNFNSPFNSVQIKLMTDSDGTRICSMKEGNQSMWTTGTLQPVPIYKQNSDSFALENYKMTSGSMFNISESGIAIGTNTVTVFNTAATLDTPALAVTNLRNPNVGLFEVCANKSVFNTVVEGVTPTANNHLATKQYVDSHSSSVTVDSTLSMTNNQISMPNKLSSALSQNLYKCSFDQQGRCTSATAVTIPESQHLYAHHYHFDHSGKGEVNFVIYSSKSTELTNSELGRYLLSLGCDVYYRAYPATGQSQYTGGIVSGVYVTVNSSTFVAFTLHVASYTINGNYQEDIGNYLNTSRIYIAQIF